MAIFDKQQFNSLIDNDRQLFGELLAIFRSDYPQLMQQLATAVAGEDFQSLEHVAHRLKGMLRNFFALGPSEIAASVEISGRQQSLNGVLDKLKILADELKTLEKELEQHLEKFP